MHKTKQRDQSPTSGFVLGQRIRSLREERCYSEHTVSVFLEMSVSDYLNLEAGWRLPTAFQLDQLAFVLDCSPASFFPHSGLFLDPDIKEPTTKRETYHLVQAYWSLGRASRAKVLQTLRGLQAFEQLRESDLEH